LNRTMIGLKAKSWGTGRDHSTSLNRTMIGLKEVRYLHIDPNVLSLNRTMIGLKGNIEMFILGRVFTFESNYDRIESKVTSVYRNSMGTNWSIT
jgi:hypothetical protein